MADMMTKQERNDLLSLVKKRERVCKTAAEQRSAALLADFEAKIAAVHPFDKDEVWKAIVEETKQAFDAANERIARRASELGIPEEFQPSLHMAWERRGENEFSQRRAELRRVAKAEIDALEAQARAEIERQSVVAQTEIISSGLTSDGAKDFLSRMSSVEALMPTLDIKAVEDKLLDKKQKRLTLYDYN